MPAGMIYCIEDVKAKSTQTFWLAENEDVALRLLSEPVNDPTHAWGKHPRDYELFEIGEWDPDNKAIHSQLPRHVCNLAELVEDQIPSHYGQDDMKTVETTSSTEGRLTNGS